MTSSNSNTNPKEEQFILDLVQFYKNKGIQNVEPAQFVSKLNGNVVPLSDLYSFVIEAGGSYKVNQFNLWDDIYYKLFKSNLFGTNFAVALRQIYNRLLLQYEKENSGTQVTEQWNEDEDGENIFRTAGVMIGNQTYYPHGYQIHQMQQINQQKKFSDDVTESSGMVHNNVKLYCSLLSGLPNELSFAYDIATILSNCSRFDWTHDYKLINVLLESIKNYCCICDRFDEDRNLHRNSTSEEEEVRMLFQLIHSRLKSLERPSKIASVNGEDNDDVQIIEYEPPQADPIPMIERTNCHCYQEFWYSVCQDEETLSLALDDNDDADFDSSKRYFPLHLMNKIEQRIELVGEMIRNTSFSYDTNTPNRVSQYSLIRFVALLARSDNVRFLNMALDILANVSPALKFLPRSKPHAGEHNQLLNIVFNQIADIALNSANLHETAKSFEILSRYISEVGNDAYAFLEAYFQNNQIYNRITHLMTCQFEVTLVLALLEFCLNVSETRPGFLTSNENKTLIKLLITFLNLEASQHFSTGALKKIKMYDDRPKLEAPQQEAAKSFVVFNRPQIVQQQQQQQAQALKMNNIQQAQPSIIENEVYANNWLKSNYDEVPGKGKIQIQDIYAEYVKYCCRNSRKNVIAAQSFNLLLRKCFPTCVISHNNAIVEGILAKKQQQQPQQAVQQQTIVAAGTGGVGGGTGPNPLMSPILKAHLSTPPKTCATPPPATESASTQPPPATTATSTLIKSLLANKLRNNQQIAAPGAATPAPVPAAPAPAPVVGTKVATTPANPQIVIQNPQPQQVQILQPPTQPQQATATASAPNTIMVPSGAGQQQQPAQASQPQQQQQLMLVRTIITMPNGQNNQAVRLILPTSMLQQRMPVPAVNGVVAPNNIVQPAAQPANVVASQPQQQTPATGVAIGSEAAKPPATIRATTPNASSPLLNVLLDKGKLPEPSSAANNDGDKPNAPAMVSVLNANKIDIKPKVAIDQAEATTTTLVNGGVKTSDHVAPKHSLQNVHEDSNKKLKTENSAAVEVKQETIPPAPIVNSVKEENVDDKVVDNGGNGAEIKVPEGSNSSTQEQQTQLVTKATQPLPKAVPSGDLECQWANCSMKFFKPADVFYHVHTQHIMVPSCPAFMNCVWGGPEGKGPGCLAKRPKYSLLTHLEDFHCNLNALKQEAIRKKQLALTGMTNIQATQPPAHPGYAHNAAMLAIRRISNTIEPIILEPANALTPLTVSIRLTSALILRNLAQRSQAVKKTLAMYEPLLCEISTIDGREESRTIAQMLAILNETSGKKP